MAWTDPATYTTSEVVTATKLNTHIRDNMRELWHEVAYTEFTANVGVGTTISDVVSSGAITYGGFPIVVEFFALQVANFSAINQIHNISLYDGATDLGVIAQNSTTASLIPWGFQGGCVARRFTPSAASHTYKIRAQIVSGTGTQTIYAGAGGAATLLPGYIRVWQKGG